ncbi:LysR family transcriptional regulator [Ramlibacter sp. WS9]|uniref:LysR family transcriptional regulator n=1 Tax=Ramlibacter sp. WS9 TaxID=1882741 RepID=UPI001144BF8A|nr:LysR family transcriptional regulator [Ramlibacter sp. WS9]ROZ75037.1 LysR family transcriptional regulator [Ramlibacter sp. WS9]
MENIDLRLLLLFDEVFKTGSLSRAGERLGMSQPGASLALGRLRTHFNDPLFVRTAAGMEATALAQGVASTVRDAIVAMQAAMSYRLQFVPADSDRVFRISMTDVGQTVILPMLLNRLNEVAAHVRVEVSTIDMQIHKSLEAGELDLAVGFVTSLEKQFFQQLLFEEEFVCLARRGHPRVGEGITRRQYELESHAVVATSGTGHQLLDRTLERLKVRRRVSVRIPSFLGLATIIGATDYLCTLPRRAGVLMAAGGSVKLLELPFKVPSYPVKQHWHARQATDPGHQWLRGVLAGLYARSDPPAAGTTGTRR